MCFRGHRVGKMCGFKAERRIRQMVTDIFRKSSGRTPDQEDLCDRGVSRGTWEAA